MKGSQTWIRLIVVVVLFLCSLAALRVIDGHIMASVERGRAGDGATAVERDVPSSEPGSR